MVETTSATRMAWIRTPATKNSSNAGNTGRSGGGMRALGQGARQLPGHLFGLVRPEVPVNRALETLGKGNKRLPSKDVGRKSVVADAIVRPRGFGRVERQRKILARVTQDLLDGLDNLYSFHRTDVDGPSVVDALGRGD